MVRKYTSFTSNRLLEKICDAASVAVSFRSDAVSTVITSSMNFEPPSGVGDILVNGIFVVVIYRLSQPVKRETRSKV